MRPAWPSDAQRPGDVTYLNKDEMYHFGKGRITVTQVVEYRRCKSCVGNLSRNIEVGNVSNVSTCATRYSPAKYCSGSGSWMRGLFFGLGMQMNKALLMRGGVFCMDRIPQEL